MNRRKHTLVFILLISLITTSAIANDSFRYAIGGFYGFTDHNDGSEFTILEGAVLINTNPVSYENGPYAEANFLDRQTNFIISIGDNDLDVSGVNINGSNYFLGFEYADQLQPYTYGLDFLSSEINDTIFGGGVNASLDILTFSFGIYTDVQTQVMFDISQIDNEFTIGNLTLQSDAVRYSVSVKDVGILENNRAIAIRLGFSQTNYDDGSDNDSTLSIIADYYLNKSTNITGGINILSTDDSFGGETYTIGIQSFVDPLTSIAAEFDQFSGDQSSDDSNSITLFFERRFN